MKPRVLFIGAILSLGITGFFPENEATADATRTPTLTLLGLHNEATEELAALVRALPSDVRAKIPGTYVAFSSNASDVAALAACDDDGDFVVVVSDALLRLTEHVTHTGALGEMGASYKLSDLAAYYAREQRVGERLLPAEAGAFDSSDSRVLSALHTLRFRQALSAILAGELALVTNGDLACPHPTATHERDDDTWSAEEDASARAAAESLYASRERRDVRDHDALALPFAAGRDAQGYLVWLEFMARFEQDWPSARWTYGRLHPNAGARFSAANAITDERSKSARP